MNPKEALITKSSEHLQQQLKRNGRTIIISIIGDHSECTDLERAMCNRDIDHKILDELTLYIADKFDGLIDFGGQISVQSGEIMGKTWEIPYETASGMTAFYNVADVDFMKDWIGNKNFRMIK